MLGVRRKNVDFVGLLQNLRKRQRPLMLDQPANPAQRIISVLTAGKY